MSNGQSSSGSRIILGMILVFIGILYLLSTLDMINLNIPHIIFSFPFIIFVIGIILVANSRDKVFGAILTVLGAFFLLPRVLPNLEYNSDIIIPVLIIAFGIFILFNRKKKHVNYPFNTTEKKLDSDYIDDVSIFGGGHKTFFSDNFKGGNITAIFGGSEIDLSQCKLAEGEIIIDVVMIFGGSTILVPRDWNVRINVTPVFGGFSNKVYKVPNQPVDSTRMLIIKGVAIFGGGEIKYY